MKMKKIKWLHTAHPDSRKPKIHTVVTIIRVSGHLRQ